MKVKDHNQCNGLGRYIVHLSLSLTWNMSVRLSLSITIARSLRLTIAKRVARDTATRDTSMPKREVGDACGQTDKVKDAATHLMGE